MVRKTALVTAMLGAFASQAIAMGLGEIQLHSALNQPLLAEIELLSPTAADLNDLRATLASREAYAKAGVERGFFHTKLRFEVIKRPNGTAAIKVTSHDPVREPYLDFLLEATWGSGQALREYTVLVDPPVLMPAPAPEYDAPVTEYSAPAREYSAPVYSGDSGGRAASGLVDGEYHVRRNDTAWGVANSVRPDGSVSMEQVMISLLRANPNAFINQNINNLKAGQILRVPSRDEMAAITHAAAVADVRAQTNQWRGGSAPAPTPAASAAPSDTPAAPASDAAPDADAQLKLVAPKAEEDTAAAKATTGDQSLDEIRKELTLASEAVEAQRLENSDLSSRVKELEDQISKLHGLIELKDNEMARLAGTAAPIADGAVAPGTETAPGETAPTTDAELTAPTAPTAPMAELPSVETPAEDTSAAAPADEAATPETESSVPAPEVIAAAPPIKPSEADEGLLASLLANPLIKWGAVGAAVVIGLLAWMSGRRRRMEDANFQESILAGRHPGDTKKAVRPASPVAAASTVAAAAEAVAQPKAPKVKDAPQTDSSLFTDFAVSDMGNIQSDAEADPIAEADVYLAYGRYQQAEELIRTALTRAPQRNELRFKLLEVLFAAKNAHAFDTEAEALLATLGSQEDEMWLRTVDMGQELNPGNPLYRAGGLTTATAAAELDEGLDFNLGGRGTAETDFSTPQDLSAQRNDNSLEFDLGEFDAFSPQAGDAAPSMPIEEDLNFDLSIGDDDGEGLLASADEVATKLDLARAYVEMGDPDGARSILQEVLDEGNVAQKSEAQTLLSQIT